MDQSLRRSNEHAIAEWNDGSFGCICGFPLPSVAGSIFADIKDTSYVDHYFTTGSGAVHPGDWQHLAVTYDKSTNTGPAVLYYNGQLVWLTYLGTNFTPRTIGAFCIGVWSSTVGWARTSQV